MYLTDVADYAGATALCPGGHRKMFEYWYRRSAKEGDLTPECTPELNFGEPVPFVGNAGDIVFLHYLLPHTPTPNHGNTIRMALNAAVIPSQTTPYQLKEGPPTKNWTPLDWTLRTDNL
jgi:ectoine hydroxylase-related dioxygenase (phytanoyl-CoA dioxygenase family)